MRATLLAMAVPFLFSAWGDGKSAVYLDDLPTVGNVHLLFTRDTLTNCDPDSRVRKIVQDSLPVKQKNDALFFPVLKADSLAIQQLTFLNRTGDSLFFMATVTDSSSHFYTSLCVDRKKVVRFSVEGSGTSESETKPGHHAGGMGGHHGGGMGGMR